MLANGGKNVELTLVKDVIKPDGTKENKEDVKNFVNNKLGLETQTKEDLNIKQENLNAVLEGMRSVTTETRRNCIFCI